LKEKIIKLKLNKFNNESILTNYDKIIKKLEEKNNSGNKSKNELENINK